MSSATLVLQSARANDLRHTFVADEETPSHVSHEPLLRPEEPTGSDDKDLEVIPGVVASFPIMRPPKELLDLVSKVAHGNFCRFLHGFELLQHSTCDLIEIFKMDIGLIVSAENTVNWLTQLLFQVAYGAQTR